MIRRLEVVPVAIKIDVQIIFWNLILYVHQRLRTTPLIPDWEIALT